MLCTCFDFFLCVLPPRGRGSAGGSPWLCLHVGLIPKVLLINVRAYLSAIDISWTALINHPTAITGLVSWRGPKCGSIKQNILVPLCLFPHAVFLSLALLNITNTHKSQTPLITHSLQNSDRFSSHHIYEGQFKDVQKRMGDRGGGQGQFLSFWKKFLGI